MKATKAQIQARVEEVLAIRLDGAEFWHVREYAREKEQEEGSPWHLTDGAKPLSDGQLWRYMARADKLVAESCRASRKKLLRTHLARRRNIFGKAMSAGDYRAALAAADSEAKLQGLYDAAGSAALLPPCSTAADVPLLLAAIIDRMSRGQLDTKTANTVGSLAAVLLRAFEGRELAEKIEELERLMKEMSADELSQPRQQATATGAEQGGDAPEGDPPPAVSECDLGGVVADG